MELTTRRCARMAAMAVLTVIGAITCAITVATGTASADPSGCITHRYNATHGASYCSTYRGSQRSTGQCHKPGSGPTTSTAGPWVGAGQWSLLSCGQGGDLIKLSYQLKN
jgi:hypothetical protein